MTQYICRRCAVYMPVESVTFKGSTGYESRELAMKHLVEVHPSRAIRLMMYFGDLLMVAEEYLNTALRDHNAEGEFNLDAILIDQDKKFIEYLEQQILERNRK